MDILNPEDNTPEKSSFLSELGLGGCEEENEREDIWEDCSEGDFVEEPAHEQDLAFEENNSSSDENSKSPCIVYLQNTPSRNSQLRFDYSERGFVSISYL